MAAAVFFTGLLRATGIRSVAGSLATGIRSVTASPEVRFLGGALETAFFFAGPGLALATGSFFVGASAAGVFIAGSGLGRGLGSAGGLGSGRGLGSARTQAGIWARAGRAISVNVNTMPSPNDTATIHQCTWAITA
ncbi:hypothetical protein C0J29_25460 [Mycobacterium paragordonae]|nr:hypothetical protein C0J29_25460 [Mycobacterium paragordonae]